jgi:GH24 family phage-related lysozyme (muramidase)
MRYIDDAVTALLKWEGTIPWMYLDTRGNVTVGCGAMLPNPGAACNLPFQSPAGGDASPDEIVADFNRVKAMSPARPAGFYEADTSPTLTKPVITTLLSATVAHNDATLCTAFSGWGGFPASVKVALLDMEYNVGEGELLRGYPKMDAAIRAGDWRGAADQCHRNGISDARNDWTRYLFLTAANG